MTRILVTGGAGYIGSHFCKLIARNGHELYVFDNLSTGNKWALRWGTFIKGDLQNMSDIDYVLSSCKPDIIIHFAGSALVEESIIFPEKYISNNAIATSNLVQMMHIHEVKDIIFSSTCAIYGEPKSFPITEDVELNPINIYGISKLKAEQSIKVANKQWGLRYTILRYFNVAGCDPELEIGEYHNHETHLIPNILSSIYNKKSVRIYGDDYNTRDGTCIRDYIHVIDIVNAHMLAIDLHLKDKFSDVILNLGSGKPCSIKEIIKHAEEITNQKLLIDWQPRRKGDPPILYSDNSKARSLLDWSPQKSKIDLIIKDAWNWEKTKEEKIKIYMSNSK